LARFRLLLIAAVVAACRDSTTPTLFEQIPPRSSGVTFANTLPSDDTTFNILNYLYYYNGGGVAVGDVDGDGLLDLYFTSNLGANRLYRNKGNFQFEDVTARAGVADSVGWKSGVTMADVNGDGRVDIFVAGVDYLTMHGRNVLYINNGDGTFTDRTHEYGLDFAGYSTQAAFFDYDGDGDLDMYLLNSSTHIERAAARSTSRTVRSARAGDRLYRNDNGHFVDVSEQAGIYGGVEGFGLGVAVSDVNGDGCPDIYVANDFPENDFLYINNCNGTFTESIERATGHTSRFSMGADAADFNNDGRPDLVVLDMLPDSEPILKTAASAESYALFNLKLSVGYHAQYARNTLQLNRGVVDGTVRFSDIGPYAGVEATDWSWAPLLADLDNDGWKDLFITNGIWRRPNDLDFIASFDSGPPNLARLPHVPLSKYAFHNNGDLTFTNMAGAWGLAAPGFSNGAVYADLDNDGALDLIVNNTNAPASLYRNRARTLDSASRHGLTVTLRGAGANTQGLGTKVLVSAGGRHQLVEAMPTRGFESSVDPRPHFGLGTATAVDSLTVIWPDRRAQVLTDVAADHVIALTQSDARPQPPSRPSARPPVFSDVTNQLGITYRHRENPFFDFSREPLMPHLLSQEGPALAVGDVNGDGLDDIVAGGAKWQAAEVWLQQRDGHFRPQPEPGLRADSLDEDVDAALFDADGNGTLDLYVVSGGNEFWEGAPLEDRLYLNDGRGNFRRATDALPSFTHNGSCVVAGDFNRDGHIDLFVGSRDLPRQYGKAASSYLLENDRHGRFRDVTTQLAPELAQAGMVTSAAWLDYDGDGKLDLVVVGEWMPVRVFHQESGRFVERTKEAGLEGTNGWWNHVSVADLNGDAKPDLILGNLGLNSTVRASLKEPARLYVGDFAHSGRLAQILTTYRHGVSYPFAGRDELIAAIPSLRTQLPTHAAFGAKRIEDILPKRELEAATVLEADTFASAIALNNGNGTFALHALPPEAQLSPIYAILAGDLDGDGHVDLLTAGNFYGVTPAEGWYDAGYGSFLKGDGHGGFAAVDMETTGLLLDGQVRRLAIFKDARGRRTIVAARNNDFMKILR
jgi:hypothetical protein